MNKLIIIFVLGSLLLISCSPDRNWKSTNDTENPVVDTNDVITSKDTKDQIRAKLKLAAELDSNELSEITLYDEYFKSEITKFYMKDNFGKKVSTAIVCQDRIRYMQMLIQYVGDTATENKQKHLKRIKGKLEKAIESGEYQIADDTYLKIDENDDIWYNAYIVSESKKSREQSYFVLMAPEADFKYLKYKVNSIKAKDGYKTEFVLEK